MKIAIISTDSNPTPPIAYGSETYFWEIANNLGIMGHDVTLYAIGGSKTPHNGKLRLITSNTLEAQTYRQDSGIEAVLNDMLKDQEIIKDYENELLGFDIIHDCSNKHYVAEYMRDYYNKTNSVNTINGNWWLYPHNPFNIVVGSKKWKDNGLKGKTGWEETPFEAQYKGLMCGRLKDARIIPWGIDTDFYCPSDYKKNDYYLWLSRFHPAKGTDVVINLAKKMGFKLVLAGSTQVGDHPRYAKMYLDMAKGVSNISFFDNPRDSQHHTRKRELYRHAKALIFPIQNHEPFGLVVVEALACGCPVIATNRGAMGEIIDDNKTGYLVDTYNLDDWADKINKLDKIDLKECVAGAKQFDTKIITKQYLELYQRVIDGERW